MKSYIRNFIRNLKRQKSVSVLAIGSLSIGIAVSLLIGMWVFTEFRFDRFHEKADHIYRVSTVDRDMNWHGSSFRQLGDRMKDGFPEVEQICRTAWGGMNLWINHKPVETGKIRQVEENFFTFFTFPLLTGDPVTCLNAPYKMVVSEKTAKKWFGDQNPVGQMVQAEKATYTISAVMKDIPYYSHIQADVIVPFYGRCRSLDCPGDLFITYLYVPVLSDFTALEKKLTQVSDETNSLMKQMGIQCKLEPLTDIHFGPIESDHGGNKLLVYLLGGSALAILLIACINFVNLFIATSFLRAREIGIKKTYGAGQRMLMFGFFRETLGYVLLAIGIAVVLAVVCLPLFNRLAGYQLELGFDSPVLYLYLCGVFVITLLAAGAYPAFYMTRFNVLETLNGKFKGKKLSVLQNSLLVVQFTVTVAFLVLILFVHKQVNYMIDYDLGFDKKNVLYAYVTPNMTEHYEAVRNELLEEASIQDVAIRNALPMYWADGYPLQKPGTDERLQVELCQVADNYFELMHIPLLEGENPFLNHKMNNGIVLDEEAVKQLELKEPLGATLEIWGMNFIVKGVAKYVYTKPLNDLQTYPIVYMPCFFDESNDFAVLCKVTGHPQQAIQALQQQWEKYISNLPFSYGFLDDAYGELYESETRLGNIFLCAMVITLLLSVSGLFAMAYYTMMRRLKEVGVRKVNGASTGRLVVLLNINFVRLILVAYVVACAVAYYVLTYWLQSFLIRTSLSLWVFICVGLIALVVTLLTVSFLTFRAARVNPVEVLKSE